LAEARELQTDLPQIGDSTPRQRCNAVFLSTERMDILKVITENAYGLNVILTSC
jgi:hypothetical protein